MPRSAYMRQFGSTSPGYGLVNRESPYWAGATEDELNDLLSGQLMTPTQFEALPDRVKSVFGNYRTYINNAVGRSRGMTADRDLYAIARTGDYIPPEPGYPLAGSVPKTSTRAMLKPGELPKTRTHIDIYGRPSIESTGEHEGFGGKRTPESLESAQKEQKIYDVVNQINLAPQARELAALQQEQQLRQSQYDIANQARAQQRIELESKKVEQRGKRDEQEWKQFKARFDQRAQEFKGRQTFANEQLNQRHINNLETIQVMFDNSQELAKQRAKQAFENEKSLLIQKTDASERRQHAQAAADYAEMLMWLEMARAKLELDSAKTAAGLEAAQKNYEANMKALGVTIPATAPGEGGTTTPQTAPAEQTAGEQPPVPGARQAPDGKWYVKKNGKWYLVE